MDLNHSINLNNSNTCIAPTVPTCFHKATKSGCLNRRQKNSLVQKIKWHETEICSSRKGREYIYTVILFLQFPYTCFANILNKLVKNWKSLLKLTFSLKKKFHFIGVFQKSENLQEKNILQNNMFFIGKKILQ